MVRRSGILALLSALPPVAGPASLGAQEIRGKVAVVDIAEPIPRAMVLLSDTAGTVVAAELADSLGEFRLSAGRPGRYVLRAYRAGFKPAAAVLEIATTGVVSVRINLRATEAVVLEGITIYGERAETAGQREFLSRQDLPWGRRFDREALDEMRVGTTADVLKFGAMTPLATCMDLYLDGRSVSDTTLIRRFPLDWVYGIEVYREYTDVPIRYRNPRSCGAVLIWTTTVGTGR